MSVEETAGGSSTSGDAPSGGGGVAVATVDDHLDIPARRTGDAPAEPSAQPAAEAPAAQPEPEAAKPMLAADILHQLAEARLKPVAGEDNETALRRLNRHYSGLSRKHYSKVDTLEQKVTRLTEIAESQARAEWQRVQAAQREQQMASLPDKEVDPQGYNTALLETLAKRQIDGERQAAERNAEEGRLAQILDVDEAAFNEVENRVHSDPEDAAAFEFATESGRAYVDALYPDAAQADKDRLVELVQQNEIRTHHLRGMNYLDTQRMALNKALDFARRHGYMPAPQPVAMPPQQAAATPVQQQAARQPGSPTAQRLQAESAQARARQAVAPGGRAGAVPTGEGVDLRQIETEEDYVRLRISGAIKDGDYDHLAAQQFGRERLG